MTTDDLDRLTALAEAATPGPWDVDDFDPSDIVIWGPADPMWRSNVGNWARSNETTDEAFKLRQKVEMQDAADAALIVALRNNANALIESARLGLAWNRVEAALPEGWQITSVGRIGSKSLDWWQVRTGNGYDGEVEQAEGGPAVPLLALAAKLEALK